MRNTRVCISLRTESFMQNIFNKCYLSFIILITSLVIPSLEMRKIEAVKVYSKPTINVGSHRCCYYYPKSTDKAQKALIPVPWLTPGPPDPPGLGPDPLPH